MQPIAFIPIKPRRQRKQTRSAAPPAPPPVGPPVLRAAVFGPTDFGTAVTLTFDRPINIAGLVGSGITINDPLVTGSLYDCGGGNNQPAPSIVQMTVVEDGAASGTQQILNVPVGNGIVSASDASAWAGCVDVVLPFP